LRAYERDDLEKARMIYNDPDVNKFLRLDVPYPLKVEDEVKWYEGLNPFGNGAYTLLLKQLLMENSSFMWHRGRGLEKFPRITGHIFR